MPQGSRPKVFYDGVCPLCRREIAHYQQLDQAAAIEWIEIQAEPECLAQYGLERGAALRQFHLLDSQGEWQRGAAAFVTLWSYLPRYRLLARLIRTLRLLPLLQFGYGPLTRWRLRHRDDLDCDCDSQCSARHDLSASRD